MAMGKKEERGRDAGFAAKGHHHYSPFFATKPILAFACGEYKLSRIFVFPTSEAKQIRQIDSGGEGGTAQHTCSQIELHTLSLLVLLNAVGRGE